VPGLCSRHLYILMKIFFIIAIVLLVSRYNVFSQKVLKDTVVIDEVTVKGIKTPEEDKSLVPMQSITRIELDHLSGNTAADAVKSFSGIIIKDYGGIGGLKTVMVRSLGANHTGVFVDGVQFSDVATGQVDLGKISTENAENISLYIGQPAIICQPARFYASANVISINYAEPDFKNKPFLLKLGSKTGSFGLIKPFVSFQNKLGKKSYADISCNYTKANGKYPFLLQYGSNKDTTAYRKNSDMKALNLNAAIVSVLHDSSKVSLKFYYYDSERGLPGAVVYYNPFTTQRLWNRDFFSNIQYKTVAKKRLQCLTNIKFSQNWLRYLDPEYLNTEGKLDNHYMQREYYLSQALTWQIIDSLHLSFATDIFVNTLRANLYQYAQPTRYSSLSAFALQYSRSRWEVNGNLLATLVREKTEKGGSAPDRNNVTPSISFGYRITHHPHILLRLLYKDVFRMPTFNDLYYNLVGNNNLKPEYVKQYNAGLTGYYHFWIFEYISFKADAFYNQVKDKIIAVPTKNLFVWSMRNIGKVECKGIELQSTLQTCPIAKVRYSLTSNYTYQDATDVTTPGSTTFKQQIPYIPFETFSTMSSISYKDFSFSYNVLFNGFRYVLGENIYANMIPSWWTNDISALYDLKTKKCTLKIKGEISNLLNKQYEVIRSFPMPGRTYSISLTLAYL